MRLVSAGRILWQWTKVQKTYVAIIVFTNKKAAVLYAHSWG